MSIQVSMGLEVVVEDLASGGSWEAKDVYVRDQDGRVTVLVRAGVIVTNKQRPFQNRYAVVDGSGLYGQPRLIRNRDFIEVLDPSVKVFLRHINMAGFNPVVSDHGELRCPTDADENLPTGPDLSLKEEAEFKVQMENRRIFAEHERNQEAAQENEVG